VIRSGFSTPTGSGHICHVGPTDQTIDPGDEGTADAAVPGSGTLDELELARLDLALRAAQLRRDEIDLDFRRTTELINAVMKTKKQ
jgi:hypothetical protein